MRHALVGVLGLAACDVVYGLDGRGEAGAPIRVEGRFTSHWIYNTADGIAMSSTRPVEEPEFPVATAFGEAVDVDFDVTTGEFSFDAPVPYELRFGNVEWQTRSPALVLDEVWFARPEAEPAADVELAITIAPAISTSATYELFSTGVWNRQVFVPSASGTAVVDWTKGGFFGGTPRRVDTAVGDTLTLMTYGPTATPGRFVLSQSASAEITMVEGSQPVAFTLAPPPNQACAHVEPTTHEDIERLKMRYPELGDGSNAGWEVYATWLSEQHGPRLAIPLAYRHQSLGDSEPQDVGFGNPFPETQVFFAEFASVSRVFATYSVNASVVHRKAFTPSTSNPCVAVAASESLGLPHDIELAGIPLTNDALAVGADDRGYLDLTWSVDRDLPDAYTAVLYEVGPTALTARHVVNTLEPRARFDAATFEPDKRYMVRVSAIANRPSARDGDFTRRPLPDGFAQVFSSAFMVVR